MATRMDTYRHRGMRRQLVEELRERGIQNEQVLATISAIPRHLFMDQMFEEWAYQDKAFPIGKGQTISQPFTVAYQTHLLDLEKRMKVLEIGTGSGYQAAILGFLGARVYTIERQEALYYKTSQLLHDMQIGNIRTYWKDGYLGLPEFAPFDRILVTAAAPEFPKKLLTQLKIGGKLVIPVGDHKGQTMYRITRIDEKEFEQEVFDAFRFVPMLKGTESK